MTEERVDPPYQADERAMLVAWLDWHRATLARKCEGLSGDQLRSRAVPPSALSLLGLVRHMAEVERAWFRRGVEQEDIGYRWIRGDDEDADFNVGDQSSVEEGFAAWTEEIARARAVVAAAPSLEATFERHRDRDEISLRWVLVHMVEEYARHNGHADLLRERIDGATGD
ncbi:MAG: DinB family protein [Acidimicrobiales bacterium]